MHLEEAGILRAGPGVPDQQWPTVSSATPGKEPGLSILIWVLEDNQMTCFSKTKNVDCLPYFSHTYMIFLCALLFLFYI